MEDDKLKELFVNFNPEISSDSKFMARLKRSMEAIEVVKQHNMALRRRNKAAVLIAAASGFVMGAVISLLMPVICNWLTNAGFSMPSIRVVAINFDSTLMGWVAMAAVCGIVTLNVYEIALAKLTPKESLA